MARPLLGFGAARHLQWLYRVQTRSIKQVVQMCKFNAPERGLRCPIESVPDIHGLFLSPLSGRLNPPSSPIYLDPALGQVYCSFPAPWLLSCSRRVRQAHAAVPVPGRPLQSFVSLFPPHFLSASFLALSAQTCCMTSE